LHGSSFEDGSLFELEMLLYFRSSSFIFFPVAISLSDVPFCKKRKRQLLSDTKVLCGMADKRIQVDRLEVM
jgi:hypothetical protein